MNKELGIIIVTYNSSNYIKNCLESIPKDFKVIVVDNNSKDNTVKIAKTFSNVTIIKNNKNLGYGKACNIGLEKLGLKLCLLLNPDIVITNKAIVDMLCYFKKSNIDILAPKLIGNNSEALLSCHRFPTFKALIGRRLGIFSNDVNKYLMKDYDHKSIKRVNWVSGACMMFESFLRFDERFFLYFEDVDFCQGRKVVYNPQISVKHVARRESVKSLWLFLVHVWSGFKFFVKNLM